MDDRVKFHVENSSFALVELGVVLACAALWFVWPGLSWMLLPVALFPWLFRIAAGRFPFRRTPFDLPLVFFLLTASIGVWASYDRERAWAKFWILVAAVLLYYALTHLEEDGLWKFAGFLSLFGALLAVYFLLTNDWQSQQSKIPLINQAGGWWMSVRPTIQAPAIHPNNAASIIAVLAPFSIATVIRQRRKKANRLDDPDGGPLPVCPS